MFKFHLLYAFIVIMLLCVGFFSLCQMWCIDKQKPTVEAIVICSYCADELVVTDLVSEYLLLKIVPECTVCKNNPKNERGINQDEVQ